MKKIAIWSFLIILVIGIFSLDNPLKHRLDRVLFAVTGQTKQLWENESAYIRSYLIEKGFELATERPFTGVGLDNAQFHIMWPTKDTGSFLHNTYLDILTSGGFLMFLLYYFPIFFALGWLFMKRKYFKKSTTYLGQMWLCSLLLLSLKVVYDITWTTYFEFAVVFSVTFSIYSTLCLKKELNSGKNFIYSKYS